MRWRSWLALEGIPRASAGQWPAAAAVCGSAMPHTACAQPPRGRHGPPVALGMLNKGSRAAGTSDGK